MKTLSLLRHAKSAWKDQSCPDHDRRLNKRGKRDAPNIGLHLRSLALPIDFVLCSSAARARATADRALAACHYQGPLLIEPRLYQATPVTMAAVVGESVPHDARSVRVIGHNPGLEEWLALITDSERPMPTGALAVVELRIDRWDTLTAASSGELRHFHQPTKAP